MVAEVKPVVVETKPVVEQKPVVAEVQSVAQPAQVPVVQQPQ